MPLLRVPSSCGATAGVELYYELHGVLAPEGSDAFAQDPRPKVIMIMGRCRGEMLLLQRQWAATKLRRTFPTDHPSRLTTSPTGYLLCRFRRHKPGVGLAAGRPSVRGGHGGGGAHDRVLPGQPRRGA